LDQFIRVEADRSVAFLDGVKLDITDDLKLYTLYSPEHRDKTIHPTKAAAVSHGEHFDGRTTE
jgi:hypothetical protein